MRKWKIICIFLFKMRLSAVFRYLLLYIDVTRLNYVMHALMPAWCAFIFACVLSFLYDFPSACRGKMFC
ncbi:MAG TPA: hypothetical protein DEB43_05720 [Desulfovibrio sp.]|nr:hypothetical protein [Desulfovibrio sp.]